MQHDSADENGTAREHYVRPANEPSLPPTPAVYTRWERFTRFLNRLVADRTPGDRNSIAPRGYDGKRTRIFFFNGNGQGR
ncbi:hypothetical protein ACWEQL_12680 [Kitasatospora sp. NPDC004240]